MKKTARQGFLGISRALDKPRNRRFISALCGAVSIASLASLTFVKNAKPQPDPNAQQSSSLTAQKGDGICQSKYGERTPSADNYDEKSCGRCGNGKVDEFENPQTCPADYSCGNGIVDQNEEAAVLTYKYVNGKKAYYYAKTVLKESCEKNSPHYCSRDCVERKQAIPERKPDAISGAEFLEGFKKVYGVDYEEAITHQILGGNVPDFMRLENFREITLTENINGAEVEIRLKVCSDYLAIGGNDDYARIPLSPVGLQILGSVLGMSIPTKKLVDRIYEIAREENSLMGLIEAPIVARSYPHKVPHPTKKGKMARLSEIWNIPSYEKRRSVFLLKPDFAVVQSQLADKIKKERGLPRFALMCGHKKDVILDYHSLTHPEKLVQYRPFHPQGLDFGAHYKDHTDYSLGGRLVDQVVYVTIRKDGKEKTLQMTYEGVIKHPEFYKLLSDFPFDISTVYI